MYERILAITFNAALLALGGILVKVGEALLALGN